MRRRHDAFELWDAVRKRLHATRHLLLWLTVIFVTVLVSVDYSRSEECEYPDYLGTMLVPPDHRIGEFSIVLNAPDYGDTLSIQRHFAYSRILSRLVSLRLRKATAGLCDVVITQSRFPDVRAFLFVDRNPGATESNQSICRRSLQVILGSFTPDQKSVLDAAAAEAADAMRDGSDVDSSPFVAAGHVLRASLRKIYRAGSVMHALLTVDGELFKAVETDDFLRWLAHQRSTGAIAMLPILTECGVRMPQARPDAQKFPSSITSAPGVVAVSIPAGLGGKKSPVSNVVLVRPANAPANGPLTAPAVEKLCNGRRQFPVLDGGRDVTVLIRCYLDNFFGADSWALFYAEPDASIPEGVTREIMTAIARDPDVLALAERGGSDDHHRGPYLVEVTGQ
jgi:hypothetical protein